MTVISCALVVGPDGHGVVEHARRIASVTNSIVRRQHLADRPPRIGRGWVVHAHYTDVLFGPDTTAAAARFVEITAPFAERLVVSLHDLPEPDGSGRSRRRAESYRLVAEHAAAVIVAAAHERDRLARCCVSVSPTVIPLPVPQGTVPARPRPTSSERPTVGLLGFVYPGKGHELAVAAAAQAGADAVVIGGPSPGHDDMVRSLRRQARAAGCGLTVTGFVDERRLARLLGDVDVPVVAHRRPSASASLVRWLGADRRPLVRRSELLDELLTAAPAAVVPFDDAELTDAVAAAISDPGSTWRQDPLPPSWLPEAVGARHRGVPAGGFPGVVVSDVVRHGPQRWVTGNRWDLVTAELDDVPARSVAVIVPYFEQPERLSRMYAALEVSTPPPGGAEVVVADDGSAEPPPAPPPSLEWPVRILRRRDLGCRPGAARNAAVASTDADVLVFLDSDTVPSPDTIRRLAAWPSLVPDALVVGRRHHVDLHGWTPAATAAWLRDGAAGPPRLPDPSWLDDGNRSSRNLLDADARSYRWVISAVMACHRTLFDDIDGFDAARDEYGCDDWEFAWRAFTNGAVLVHEPRATAWHDDRDWSQRDGRLTAKNRQTLWFAATIPDVVARGSAIRHADAAWLIELDLDDDVTPGQLVATVDTVLGALPDALVRLPDAVTPIAAQHLCADPRITTRLPSRRGLLRARATVTVHRPFVATPAAFSTFVEDATGADPSTLINVTDETGVVVTIDPTRRRGRLRRSSGFGVPPVDLEVIAPTAAVEATTVPLRVLHDEVDLAAILGGWFERR